MKHLFTYLILLAALCSRLPAQEPTLVNSNGDGINQSAFLNALGGTTAGKNLFQLPNPSAITFPRINADNTVSALSAADTRTALGLGTAATTASTAYATAAQGALADTALQPADILTGGGTITPKSSGNLDFNNLGGAPTNAQVNTAIETDPSATISSLGRNALAKTNHGHIPTINGWKMAGLASSADGAAKNIRILQIGNSYNTSPIDQLERVFGAPAVGYARSIQNIAISNGGHITVSGGAGITGGSSQTLVPQQDGYWSIPAGGVLTVEMCGTQAWVAYVQEPGAGSLLVEESTNSGSSWTTLTTINANGTLAYQNYKPTAGTRLLRRVRMTASGGSVKVAHAAILGQSGRIIVNTGGGTEPSEWNTTNLTSGTIESWYAAYDPHLVFVSYSNNMALHVDFWTMINRLLTSCPNAQIIVTGEHAADTSVSPPVIGEASWDRWDDTGLYAARNAATQAALVNHPRVAWIDVGKWLPSLEDTDANGTYDSAQVGTVTPPDYLHLNEFGLKIKNAAIWEAMRPWIFLGVNQGVIFPSRQTVFDDSGFSYVQQLHTDVPIASNTSPGVAVFDFYNIAKEGVYMVEGYLILESTSSIGAKAYFGGVNLNLNDFSAIYYRSTTMGALEIGISGAGTQIPSATWDAATSTVRVHVRGAFRCNGGQPQNFDGRLFLAIAQTSSSVTALNVKAGSWLRLSLANQGYAGGVHRANVPGY